MADKATGSADSFSIDPEQFLGSSLTSKMTPAPAAGSGTSAKAPEGGATAAPSGLDSGPAGIGSLQDVIGVIEQQQLHESKVAQTAARRTHQVTQGVNRSAANYAKAARATEQRLAKLEKQREESLRLASSNNPLDRLQLIGAQALDPQSYTRSGREGRSSELNQLLALRGQVHNVKVTAAQAEMATIQADAEMQNARGVTSYDRLQARLKAIGVADQAGQATERLRESTLSQQSPKTLSLALATAPDAMGFYDVGGFKYTETELMERNKDLTLRKKLASLPVDVRNEPQLMSYYSTILSTMGVPELEQLVESGYNYEGTNLPSELVQTELTNKKTQAAEKNLAAAKKAISTPNFVDSAYTRATQSVEQVESNHPPASEIGVAASRYREMIAGISAFGETEEGQTEAGRLQQLKMLDAAEEEFDLRVDKITAEELARLERQEAAERADSAAELARARLGLDERRHAADVNQNITENARAARAEHEAALARVQEATQRVSDRVAQDAEIARTQAQQRRDNAHREESLATTQANNAATNALGRDRLGLDEREFERGQEGVDLANAEAELKNRALKLDLKAKEGDLVAQSEQQVSDYATRLAGENTALISLLRKNTLGQESPPAEVHEYLLTRFQSGKSLGYHEATIGLQNSTKLESLARNNYTQLVKQASTIDNFGAVTKPTVDEMKNLRGQAFSAAWNELQGEKGRASVSSMFLNSLDPTTENPGARNPMLSAGITQGDYVDMTTQAENRAAAEVAAEYELSKDVVNHVLNGNEDQVDVSRDQADAIKTYYNTAMTAAVYDSLERIAPGLGNRTSEWVSANAYKLSKQTASRMDPDAALFQEGISSTARGVISLWQQVDEGATGRRKAVMVESATRLGSPDVVMRSALKMIKGLTESQKSSVYYEIIDPTVREGKRQGLNNDEIIGRIESQLAAGNSGNPELDTAAKKALSALPQVLESVNATHSSLMEIVSQSMLGLAETVSGIGGGNSDRGLGRIGNTGPSIRSWRQQGAGGSWKD